MKKVLGLDSLRFVMAFIVLLGHGTLPLLNDSFLDPNLERYLNGILGNVAVGIAAVMAFFIISGFVIHYPFSTGKFLNIKEFYIRRILRVAIPAFVAYLIYKYTYDISMGVIWSLICEVIYYAIYPLVLRFIHKLNLLIVLTFVLSYIVSIGYSYFSDIYNGDFHRNGFLLTWILGLPVWLLGVKLAEEYKRFNAEDSVSFHKLIGYRIVVLIVSSICSILRFHLSISYVYTLPVFSFLLYFWLKHEINYYKDKKENKYLVYGGEISYSLYLVHAIVIHSVVLLNSGKLLNDNWFLCLLTITISLILSSIYHFLIERPSHKFARSVSNLFSSYSKIEKEKVLQ